MDEHLFNLSTERQQVDGTATVTPNLWLMSSADVPPLLFTPEEVSGLLRIGRHRVFDLIRERQLRSVKVGASRRISARALADYVAGLELAESP
jgi:excisionase family DNA binding protein